MFNNPERINAFLVERRGRAYCDSCIQERLGLKWREQVQLVTATLAVTPLFERHKGLCCTCGEQKNVIVTAPASSFPALPARELRTLHTR